MGLQTSTRDQFSAAARAIVAKTDRKNLTGLTLDLPSHLLDSMSVSQLILDRFTSASTRRLLAQELGGDDVSRALVSFCAGVHDVGKASVSFQSMLPVEATSGLAGVGLRVSSAALAAIPHGVVGQVAVGDWLEALGFSVARKRRSRRSSEGITGPPPSQQSFGMPSTSWPWRTLRGRRYGPRSLKASPRSQVSRHIFLALTKAVSRCPSAS